MYEMSERITTIVLPTRPQPDTIVAIFFLREFGQAQYPGILEATVVVDPKAAADTGKLLLDVGGGEFDHHGTNKCATELVAEKFNIIKNPELRPMIAYARRDDTKGQGIISKDPIDRAFGLSGLIASLNKLHTADADTVVRTVLPLLEAQHKNAYEHYVELPKLVTDLTNQKQFSSHTLNQPIKNTKIAFVSSDHMGLPGYLRSSVGGNYRVVVQRRSTGHTNIITKQNPKIDLSQLAALLRLRECELNNIAVSDERSLFTTGTHEMVSNWYYDTATNSILNGGASPQEITPTSIPWEEIQAIVLHAITASSTES